uniref:non-specific serine/threonine protein kinase n=1 Tax=Salix viminalis TaxID=40686 RepID=A0A6N2LZT2_SALVM
MTISEDGNLVVSNGQGEVLWSSNVSNGFNQSTAQLTDDGNLVLKAGPKENLVWQSFLQPTDTYLSKMRFTANKITGNKTLLTSWRSSSDPSVGNFSGGINPLGIPELFMWYNGHPFWRSGPWVGQKFIGMPGMYTSVYLNGITLQDEGDGTFTLSSIQDPAIRLTYILTSRGKFTEQFWDYEKQGNLIDIQKFSEGGADLNIRLAYTELERKLRSEETLSLKTTANFPENVNEVKLEPLFKLQVLETATNNFDISKKLGQGGFGAVYRGKLPDGQEIAVKRLSRTSGQGLEELMNEVVVISKLQHRNLVRLLGCCVEGEEMMLVYEYMPNKSLDAFLFDSLRKGKLDWERRFNIINGISRGLVYLHRDSRLRIIHRDLKPSNILLDHELYPKISDFGIARVFGGNEVNTTRVVGTFGYMAPEYLMEGRFSEKSDVFSFGVLLLEIVSGRRNAHFYDNEHELSLTGYAWKLWNEGGITAFVDPAISEPCFLVEIFRCIQIGLLCVQELAKDRPVVSTIISMLNSEIVDLPIPKKPAFVERQSSSGTESSTQSQMINSINNVTISDFIGR